MQRTAAAALLLICGANAIGQSVTPKSGSVRANISAAVGGNPGATAAVTAVPLAYQFTPGSTTHFKVSAFFDGHFPPFAQPESPPVHFKANLGYAATVKKVDKEGATVEFVVESRELYLFKREMGENEKIDLNSEDVAQMSSLTTLEDMQKALNATAILRTDGSIARILTNSSVKIPFDVGFDIRKLFLMMLPVTFPAQAVKPGDTWPATDGLLGAKPGKTVYTDKLDSVVASGANRTYRLSQKAHADVEDQLDKAGNSTAKAGDVYRTLSGKVDLTSEMTFAVPTRAQKPAAKNSGGKSVAGATQAAKDRADEIAQAGQVQSAHLTMNAVINRKRVKINPDQPEIPENDPLDVKARMTVTRVPGAKATIAATPDKTPANPPRKADNARR